MPNKNTRMAFVYDFDGTLAPGNLQENSFIPDIGMKPDEFWAEVNQRAREQQADPILMYMYLMLEKARSANVPVRLENFTDRGAGIKFFHGVLDWFDRINEYAKENKIRIDHYIISSGNGEIIDGTSLFENVKRIYASRFLFNENGVACWPKVAVNFTTKTQFLFRIHKDAHDLSDDRKINKFVPENKRAVPFNNMVYIGDGETDIPCFRLVKQLGGVSIAVYKPNTKFALEKTQHLLDEGRVHSVVPADYRNGKELDRIVKAQIDVIAARKNVQRLMARSGSSNVNQTGMNNLETKE